MSSNLAPILTADDEPTGRHDMAALVAETARHSRPSLTMIAHPAPLIPPPVVRAHSFWTRLRWQLAAWLLGDVAWGEKRVIEAAIYLRKREIAWDRSGETGDLRSWKNAQLELEHATHALVVARGGK